MSEYKTVPREKKYRSKAKISKPMYNSVRRLIQTELSKDVEYKQHSTGVAQTGFYNAAGRYLVHLTEIAQGVADTQRVGDELTLKGCHIKLLLRNGLGNVANEMNLARCIVFQYKSQDNAPTISELLLANVPSGNTQGAMSNLNIDYRNIYNILWDETYILDQGTPNASNFGNGGQIVKYIDVDIPLKYAKKKVQYEAASTSNSVNGLYLMVVGHSASITTDPTVAGSWTVHFTDS